MTFGTALGHTLIGYASLSRGLGRIEANETLMKSALNAHWEVVAEGAQSILRAAQIPASYEKLKELTRGKEITQKTYLDWVEQLDVHDKVKLELNKLSPLSYLGLSEKIAKKVLIKWENNKTY